MEVENIDEKQQDLKEEKLQEKITVYTDKYNLILLAILFFYQGLVINFMESAIQVILIQNGASWNQVGVLSFMSYPWSFKIFFAPLMDTYYHAGFGKRKTYLVPLQWISVIILLVASQFLQQWIDNMNITAILISGFLLEICYSNQDICNQGWSLTLLHHENVSYTSTVQTVGQLLGGVVGFNCYIWLSSTKFMNQTLGMNVTKPVINPQIFCIFAATVIAIGTIYIQFFKKERNPEIENKNWGLIDTLNKLKGFYRNRNILMLIILFLTYQLTTAPVDDLSDIIILRKGMSRELMSAIQFSLLPVQLISTFFTSNYCRKNKEFTVFLTGWTLNFLNNIYKYYITLNYEHETNQDYTLKLLFVNYAIGSIQGNMTFISSLSFIFRVCDVDVGGSYLTVLFSVSNFGYQWTNSFVVFLEDYVNFTQQFWISNIVFVSYFAVVWQKLLSWEKTNEEEWKLK